MIDNTKLLELLKASYNGNGKPRNDEQLIHEALSQLLFKVDRKAWFAYQQNQEGEK